ncbi:MAG: signal peptidase I [Myxococcota bacterium]
MARSSRSGGAEPEARPAGALARVWEQLSTLLLAIAIALTIRVFVIEPFRIPSESMLPTLLIGDHLFVNKFAYGAKVPFTDIRLPGFREPERGDVVVFVVARELNRGMPRIYPADKRPDLPRDDFVKRIVGLPGDRLEVRNNRLYVNDRLVEISESDGVFLDDSGHGLAIQRERLDGCDHAVLDDPAIPGQRRSPVVVPPGRYFVMGDNRDHSNDSRIWGTVRFEEIRGPAFILYWSWDVNGNFLQFLNPVNWWTAEKRWSRVFSRVRCFEPGESLAERGIGAPSATGS